LITILKNRYLYIEMNNLGFKRLSIEIKKFHESQSVIPGIYINYDPQNIFSIKALIIGPEDTPYQYGNYLFKLNFDKDNYPFVPPAAKYESRSRDIRFNPNLYVNGKVCVSILGTWAGPQWTSCQTLTTVLMSLQTLLNDHPLGNEPGFETVTDSRNQVYNKIIEYENFNVTVLKFLNGEVPEGFEIFLPIMRSEFIKNYPKIMEKVKNKKGLKENLNCTVYSFKSSVDYQELEANLVTLHSLLTLDDTTHQKSGSEKSQPVLEEIVVNKVKSVKNKKGPQESSSLTADSHHELKINLASLPSLLTVDDYIPSKHSDKSQPKIQDGTVPLEEIIIDTLSNGAQNIVKKVQVTITKPKQKASQFMEGHIENFEGVDFQAYKDKAGKMRWKKLSK
jgi:ubiquitin-conjugating enzyme E2 Z